MSSPLCLDYSLSLACEKLSPYELRGKHFCSILAGSELVVTARNNSTRNVIATIMLGETKTDPVLLAPNATCMLVIERGLVLEQTSCSSCSAVFSPQLDYGVVDWMNTRSIEVSLVIEHLFQRSVASYTWNR